MAIDWYCPQMEIKLATSILRGQLQVIVVVYKSDYVPDAALYEVYCAYLLCQYFYSIQKCQYEVDISEDLNVSSYQGCPHNAMHPAVLTMRWPSVIELTSNLCYASVLSGRHDLW